ncbi:MAG: tyrosine recombinase XerC [Oscillospiraceae bacterium]|nr:tyrosine recombinase XerC [Oscillospiraceae bacterium]
MSQSFLGCPDIIREFLFYLLTIRNLSARTVDAYWVDLRSFFRYMKLRRGLVPADTELGSISIEDVTLEFVSSVTTMDIYEYLHFVMSQRENNANTRSRKISALRSYFKYLTVKTNKLDKDPVKNLEVPSLKKSLPKYLTLEESIDLLAAVDGDFAARDYCILTLFLNCGMRLSELVGINISDIHEETITITGKGNKERQIYLNKACKKALARYLHERNRTEYKKKDRNALFLSRTGSRITPRRVEQIVNGYIEKAGLADRGFTVHKLRHTAATLMYRYGNVDILTLKEILGHEHTSTTEIYTHLDQKRLKDAAAASPLAGLDAAQLQQKKRSTSLPASDDEAPEENVE